VSGDARGGHLTVSIHVNHLLVLCAFGRSAELFLVRVWFKYLTMNLNLCVILFHACIYKVSYWFHKKSPADLSKEQKQDLNNLFCGRGLCVCEQS
jgi:hypothetical protein